MLLLTLTLLVLTVTLVLRLVHRLRSPLTHLPGPLYTALTSLPLKLSEFRGLRTAHVHALHLRYGLVVRIAPNEVSFASAAAVREIYAAGGPGYDKTEFYNLFTVYGRRTMFSTLLRAPHAARKRTLAERYANSNVKRGESVRGVEERSRRFVERCVEKGRGEAKGQVDVYTALHAYAFDCASHHLFAPSGADSLRLPRDEAVMLEVTTDASLQNRLVRYYAPTVHAWIGRVLEVVAPSRETPLADGFVLDAVAEAGRARPFTVVSRLLEAGGLDEVDVAAECADHMVAGIDTTGDALCALMWELSLPRSMAVQERLRAELRESGSSSSKDTAAGQAPAWDSLAYLDAVVMEGLRCFPAIPMSLPRYVPAGGRTIDGFLVPAGTIVSAQAHSVHRIDTRVFPDPDVFRPERWLEPQGDAERKRAFFAFASGGRGCVGKHLALAEMKILLRDVYGRFATLPGEGMSEDMMVMEDQLISARPRAQRCVLRFVEVEGWEG